MLLLIASILINSLAGILGVQVTHPMLVEVFLLDQRKVSVAFHLRHRRHTRLVFFRRSRIELILTYRPSSLRDTHHAHIALHSWANLGNVHQRLPLGELAKGCPLVVLHHVTVVAEVWVVRAALVLKGLDGRREINLALEKLLALNLVQLLLVLHIRLVAALIRGAHLSVLHLRVDLESHFSLILLRRLGIVLLVLVEV